MTMVVALSLAIACSCAAAVAAPSRACTIITDDSLPVCDTEAPSLLQHGNFVSKVQQHVTLTPAGKDTRVDAQPTNSSSAPIAPVPSSITSGHSNIYPNIAAAVVASMIFLAILPILFYNGVIPFVVVLLYLTSLIVVKFAVKQTMSFGYSYPYTITAFHMLSTALAALCFDRPGISEALKVMPVSLSNGVSLALNNTALLYGGVAFTSMVGGCAPAPTYIFEVLLGRRSHWMDGLLGTCLVCIGTVLCVHGETSASFFCFMLAAGATVCRALKSIAQQELLAVKVTPMVMLFWTGFWGLLFLMPVIILEEGAAGLKSLNSISFPARLALLLSVVSATSLNICQIFAVKQLGSLQQVTIGNLNCVLAIALAAATRGEVILDIQYLGTLLVMLGAPLSKKQAGTSKEPEAGSKGIQEHTWDRAETSNEPDAELDAGKGIQEPTEVQKQTPA